MVGKGGRPNVNIRKPVHNAARALHSAHFSGRWPPRYGIYETACAGGRAAHLGEPPRYVGHPGQWVTEVVG
eukprot:7777783-Pyramimonas_sp.AAC.1